MQNANKKRIGPEMNFQDGDLILKEGDKAQQAYLVKGGHVQIFIQDENGRRDIAKLGPGQIFGEMGLIRDYVHIATAEAVGDVILIPITKELMNAKLADVDPLIKTILTALTERLYKETLLGPAGEDDDDIAV